MSAPAPDLAAELAHLRAENAELARRAGESERLRAEVAELRPLAQLELARQRLRGLFISALICTAQNGYAREVDPFVGLCRETWGEEALFDALKDLPHGRKRLRSAEVAAAQGLPEFDSYGLGRTRLMYAVMKGDVARTEWLLKRGANMELVDNSGFTSLHQAKAWDSDSVYVLLYHNANIEATTIYGSTPLSIASMWGHSDIVLALSEKGAHLDAQSNDCSTALLHACEKGDEGSVRLLVGHGAATELSIFATGVTPLYLSVKSGHAHIVRMLLEKGGNAQVVPPSTGLTPLHCAAEHGHTEIVSVLLAHGVNADCSSPIGTPLHAAADGGHAPAISVLLAMGADVEAPHPSCGSTPLFRAAILDHVEAVKALLKGGAKISFSCIRALALRSSFPALAELLPLALAADNATRRAIRAAIAKIPY